MRIIVTGGAGFIGSALIRFLINETDSQVLNYDKLTYSGNLSSLVEIDKNPNYSFIKGDICDKEQLSKVFTQFKPEIVFNLAAETHVDRSVDSAQPFIDTNINGTFNLLEVARAYLGNLSAKENSNFKIIHVSTDEVYGSLGSEGNFSEKSPYDPSSPYSASKAASDHLFMAWYRTYGMPVIISNCSNNYGPFQFPEKLIPLNLINALEGKSINIYGQGAQIRDWLHVDDHVSALYAIMKQGKIGEKYNIGSNNEHTNLEIAQNMCEILDEIFPNNRPYNSLIKFVVDRPGHDFRYAIDACKILTHLDWKPKIDFKKGLRKTIEWYVENEDWWRPIRGGVYFGERLGAGKY